MSVGTKRASGARPVNETYQTRGSRTSCAAARCENLLAACSRASSGACDTNRAPATRMTDSSSGIAVTRTPFGCRMIAISSCLSVPRPAGTSAADVESCVTRRTGTPCAGDVVAAGAAAHAVTAASATTAEQRASHGSVSGAASAAGSATARHDGCARATRSPRQARCALRRSRR